MLNAKDWYLLVRTALPFFGNDAERVIWQADIRQLQAIVHGEMGNPGNGVREQRRKAREQELVIEKLKEVSE